MGTLQSGGTGGGAAAGRPFIYIASLRRTGSTVLCEALTKFPYSVILQEPCLAQGRFAPMDADVLMCREQGFDLASFRDKWSHDNPRQGWVDAFRRELLPVMAARAMQVGVKEIRHKGWTLYRDSFPGMKVLVTARDPRDIYISLHYRAKKGKGLLKRGASAQDVAAHLREEFKLQTDIMKTEDCLRIRYEDLCDEPQVHFSRIKEFVGSPIPDLGSIGGVLANNPRRRDEHALHGSAITTKHASRWRTESDRQLLATAQEVFDLMPEYCEFWGYQRA